MSVNRIDDSQMTGIMLLKLKAVLGPNEVEQVVKEAKTLEDSLLLNGNRTSDLENISKLERTTSPPLSDQKKKHLGNSKLKSSASNKKIDKENYFNGQISNSM